MDKQSPVLAVISNEEEREFYNQAAISLGYPFANVVVGPPAQAAQALAAAGYSPKYVILDIGDRAFDILPELDKLAECCDIETRVVIVGATNDIRFYRALIDKGIIEYLTCPVTLEQIRSALIKPTESVAAASGTVLSFIGAAAGDGSSTIAQNVAYALASTSRQPTALVDLDYQFGMVAKNLDIASAYGIKDIFEHPDRGIDALLVQRMAVSYKGLLDVIVAPNALQFMPTIQPEIVRNLIHALQERYRYVVLDLPHMWTHWASTALTSSRHTVLTAQLWLKSVTHCARMLNTWKQLGIPPATITLVINRSGSKFKEAVHPKDFERVCGHKIDFYVSNDIKAVVKAEDQGTTIMELGSSALAGQLGQLTELLTSRLATPKSGPAFRDHPHVSGAVPLLKRLT